MGGCVGGEVVENDVGGEVVGNDVGGSEKTAVGGAIVGGVRGAVGGAVIAPWGLVLPIDPILTLE
jgi:hypothetical protein